MATFSLVDESFDPNVSLSYFLSVRLNPDGLTFCTLDPVRNKYVQISNIVINSELPIVPQLDKQFAETEILNLPFKKTFILIPTRIATLVPSGIFDIDNAKSILQFCCEIPQNSNVHFNKIRQADVFNIFAINADIETIIKRQFPEPFFFHQNTPFIDGILSSTTIYDNEKNILCLNFNFDFFDILVFEKSALKSCNSFPLTSENDAVYFTLFTFEQLNITESNTTVYISGINERNKKYVNSLSRYISKIKHIDFPPAFRYSATFKDPRLVGFYDLLSLPPCVL